MTLVATAEAARANRRRATAGDGMGFWHTLYLGTTRYNMAAGEADPAPDAVFPMAFLVEQDPGEVANAHFHQADQFQVVVARRGHAGHACGAAGRRCISPAPSPRMARSTPVPRG